MNLEIPDTLVQIEVYKIWRTLLEETDKDKFLELESLAASKLNSDVSIGENIVTYFETWRSKRNHWGRAFRIGDGINTNMFVEAFHRVFKYSYLKGKQNKRLDNVLLKLIKYNRDSVFHRLIKLTKGKNTHKTNVIYKRHKTSESLTNEIKKIANNEWQIVSTSDKSKTYTMKKIQMEKCSIAECKLECPDCKICCHQYTCSCTDFLMTSLICKHIHYLHQINQVRR